jgi:hypothetical protein
MTVSIRTTLQVGPQALVPILPAVVQKPAFDELRMDRDQSNACLVFDLLVAASVHVDAPDTVYRPDVLRIQLTYLINPHPSVKANHGNPPAVWSVLATVRFKC